MSQQEEEAKASDFSLAVNKKPEPAVGKEETKVSWHIFQISDNVRNERFRNKRGAWEAKTPIIPFTMVSFDEKGNQHKMKCLECFVDLDGSNIRFGTTYFAAKPDDVELIAIVFDEEMKSQMLADGALVKDWAD